jgi:ATP-dependent Clp protease ATP-binding subunit ClpC
MRPLHVRTRVLVRELPSGESIAIPIADPLHCSFGAEETALAEQAVFFSELLARLPPEDVARFSLPDDTSLHVTDVVVPREDLPRALAIETPIPIPSVVIPTGPKKKDAWVVIVPLDHTFFVPAVPAVPAVPTGEALDDAIRSEVLRLVAAQELTPQQWLALLPGQADRLDKLDVKIERDAGGPAGRAAAHRKALAAREKRKNAAAVLESIATPLHHGIDAKHPRPMIGRDAEKRLLGSILGAEERLSVAIVGGERVGKTALLRAWLADEEAEGRAHLVYATSGAQLIAGMSGLGQWQERVRRVMDAAHTLDAIVYFDDLSDLFGERSHGIDMAGAMKPWLDDGKVRLVGELPEARAELTESRHVGFFSCLSRVRVEAMSAAQARDVLHAHAAHDRKHEPHKVQVDAAALAPIVDLAERYLPYEAFPGKAVRLYEELRASQELRPRAADGKSAPLGPGDVYDHFSLRTGVPLFLLHESMPLRLDALLAHFDRKLVGQEAAKRTVAETVCVVKAALQPAGKPLASFLFVGPTGVGKTELARALAELLFGSAERLVRFDMSEYTDPWAAARLIRGTESGEGLLTRQVREQPFCVVLLDEIEKAHPAVFDLLLQVCGEGRLTDGRGKTAFFHNAILIMTSNLGAAHRRAVVGFEERATSDLSYYMKAVDGHFRPEFVNRIDRVVAFRSLTRAEVRDVARMVVERVKTRRGLARRRIALNVSEAALEHLADKGFSDAYGARALRRHIDEHLVNPLARILRERTAIDVMEVRAESEPPRGASDAQYASFTIEGLRFLFVAHNRAHGRPMTNIWELSSMRRVLARQMRFDRVTALKAHLDYLVAQLGYGQRKDKKKHRERAVEIAQLQAEHHRLGEVWGRLDGAYADLLSAEELAFSAFLAGERFDALLVEAQGLRTRFRAALFDALVCRDSKRDAITFMASELDEGRGLEVWLWPLLDLLADRGWQAEFHIDGDKGPNWPEKRRWGPPRTAEHLREELVNPERSWRNVLCRVRGANAGIVLGLEGGLHRMHGAHPHITPVHLLVTRVAFRASLQEKDWTPRVLDPPTPADANVQKRVAPNRETADVEGGTLHIFGKRATLKMPRRDYWARIDEIALEHLLLFENSATLDRDEFLASTFTEAWDDVTDMARSGRKIEAIKLYRERTGLGLREAKDYVESLGGG